MSSMCGLVERDGRPAGARRLQRMLDALDHWGADARGEWSGEGVSLGHLLLGVTPGGSERRMPVHDRKVGLVLTGDLRLDNRSELAERLGIARDELFRLDDGDLVLRSFRKWGVDTPERLLGDFAFALWDERRRQLFCARDPFGVKPFYYHDGAETFAFASEIKGLLALDALPRGVDEVWIADFLCRLTLDRRRTFYEAVRRLEPGHTLLATPEGVRLRRYWTPDPSHRRTTASDRECVTTFREAFRNAVSRRLPQRGDVGAELSGGLDSSGICAVAHELLEREGRTLHTFGQVRPSEPVDGRLPPGGRDGIEALREHAGLAPPVLLEGTGRGASELLEWAIRRRDEPPWLIVSLFNDALYEAARARGVTVLLSGYGGNQGVTGQGAGVYLDLLLAGRWSELWDDVSAGRGTVAGLRTVAGVLLSASPLGPLARRVRERGDVFWQKFEHRPFRDDLARRVGLRERARAYRAAGGPAETSGAVTARRIEAPDVALRLEDGHAAATARKLVCRYPLLDRELLELYLAMPPRMKRRRGTGRYLFRESMKGILPESVRTQEHRASANPGGVLRKRRDRDRLLERLRSLPSDSPLFGYVDRDKALARPRLRRAADHPWERDTELLKLLVLEGKLRQAGSAAGG